MSEKDTVYKFPAAYAREHNELEAYRASKKENIACARAIREATMTSQAERRLMMLLHTKSVNHSNLTKSLPKKQIALAMSLPNGF